MNSDGWPSIELGDIVSIKHGWPFKSEFFSLERHRKPIVVNIGNFQYSGGFRFETTQVKEYLGTYPKEFELKADDILLIMTCQTEGGEILGIPGKIPDDGKIYLHNQRMGKVVIKDSDKIDSNFLYWIFLWKKFNQELVASATGTKILHTAPKRIENFRFNLPPLDEQTAIAKVLDSLNDKIELNRQMNNILERMAKALFKSWFVDFDPVVAKADGKKPIGMSDEVAALFPDKFEDSEIGPIPKGWKLLTIEELAQYVNGKNFTKNATGSGRIVIRIAELNSGISPSTIYNDVEANPCNVAKPGDLLFSWSGSLNVFRWFKKEGLINQHIFKVIPKNYPQWFVHFALIDSMPFFQRIAEGKATTMGHIKREHLRQWKLSVPEANVLKAADSIISSQYLLLLQNEEESLLLLELSDTLLPKLISGEIRIKNAEKIVSEAV